MAKMEIKVKKGAYHKQKGIPKGKKIPLKTIKKDEKSPNKLTRERAQFADNARKWNKK